MRFMEEYDRLHNIPIDVTDTITHADFVLGAKDGSVGFNVMSGEPITLVHGGRKAVFNIFVMLYLIVPTVVIPFWAYHERNWWLLLGIVVASLIAPQLAQRKGHSIGGLLLLPLSGWGFQWAFTTIIPSFRYALFGVICSSKSPKASKQNTQCSASLKVQNSLPKQSEKTELWWCVGEVPNYDAQQVLPSSHFRRWWLTLSVGRDLLLANDGNQFQ